MRELRTWMLVGAAAFPLLLRSQEPARPVPAETAEERLVLESALPLELGARAPEAAFGPWRRGAPIGFGVDGAPPCTVFAFYPGQPAAAGPALDGDADALAALQRRFGARGVRIVVAPGDADLPIPATLDPCSVVVDAGRRTARAWGVTGEPGRHVVALDRFGRTVFQGDLGGGLVDATEAVVDGTFVAAAAERAAELRFHFRERFADVEAGASGPAVEWLLQQAPRDGLAWGIAHLVAEPAPAEPGARATVAQRAVAALAEEPRALAVFADLALRGDPRDRGLAAELAGPLQQAAAAAPRDPFVQLALLRALVLADRSRDAGRQAARTAKLVAPSSRHNVEFAAILAQAGTPQVFLDLADQAVQRARALGAEDRELVAARFLVLQRCAEDRGAGKELVDAHAAALGARVAVNNECWYLLTDLSTMGRFDGFAAALAERLLAERESLDPFELDTAALAMFRTGRVAEAVELQQAAVDGGGRDNPEYAVRLQRYRAASAR